MNNHPPGRTEGRQERFPGLVRIRCPSLDMKNGAEGRRGAHNAQESRAAPVPSGAAEAPQWDLRGAADGSTRHPR
jgi:hypothetical protein